MSVLRHPNIVMFLGACSAPPCMVTEFCARGSLLDILQRARECPVRPSPWMRSCAPVSLILSSVWMPARSAPHHSAAY